MINVGLNMKLKFKSGGVVGGGSWTEITYVGDAVNLTRERGEANTSTRGSGYETFRPALKKRTLEWSMKFDSTDAVVLALIAAEEAGTLIGLRMVDEDTNYWQGDFYIFKASPSEPLEEAVTVAFTAKPANPFNLSSGTGG